jgi:hypothetical protein
VKTTDVTAAIIQTFWRLYKAHEDFFDRAILAEFKRAHPDLVAAESARVVDRHLLGDIARCLDAIGIAPMHPPESSQGLWLLDGLPGHQLPLFVEYVDSHGERRRKTPALLTLPEFDSVIELAADKVTRATRVVEDWLEKRKALLPYWEGYPARTLAEAYEAKAKAESEA